MLKFLTKIVKMILLLLVFSIQHGCCDWVSEWLTPMQLQYKEGKFITNRNGEMFDDELKLPTGQGYKESPEILSTTGYFKFQDEASDFSLNTIKYKIENTLKSAKNLAETLKRQIRDTETKERYLKEAIVNGMAGVSTLTISTTSRKSRTYFIRNGFWSICSGMIQHPVSTQSSSNIFNEIITTPRCIGHEIPTVRDPCVFNSIIKYETIPTVRRSTYEEDDYLCLKPNFNNTFEQYVSVPRQIVSDTCKRGTIKTLSDNVIKCGFRLVSEYTYYPNKNSLVENLLEYCTENNGSCKLIVAWHLSNSSIENFETLNDDKIFKKTFLKYNHQVTI